MESRERTRTHESEGVEKIRTPIDERFSFVVRTRPAPGPRYRGQEAPPDIVEATIEDSASGSVAVNLGALLMETSKSGRSASFVLGKEFTARSPLRLVEISERELSDPKEIFALLHELGHITADDERDEDQRGEISRLHSAQDPSNQELQMLIQDERDAWARAITLARLIKREHGVDLFKLFQSPDEFMGWYRDTGLRTYEKELEERGIGSYTKEDKVRAWQQSPNIEPTLSEDFDRLQKA
jgi:hypothetical protein